jgi:ActR/RegA family two-component response regulator
MRLPPDTLPNLAGTLANWGVLLAALVAGAWAYVTKRTQPARSDRLQDAQANQADADALDTTVTAAGKRADLLTTLLTRVEKLEREVQQLRDFVQNVHRSAPQLGVRVSGRGVLSIEPGQPLLVVDDDDAIADAVRLWLEDRNYVVETATTVADAIARIAARQYAVVIVDLYLDDQTAQPVVEAIRAATTARPAQVVVFTGASDQASRTLIKTLDPVTTVAKPADLADLEAAIKTALAKRASAP